MPRTFFDLPPGLKTNDTAFAASPAWADGSNVRFVEARPQTIGGWESISATLLTGVCRAAFAWSDNSNTLNLGFGTHSKLQLFQGGGIYDITPSSGFTAGQIDGTGTTGYGTGAFGIGGYGSPSSTDYFPLTWSLGAWGQKLIASPRNQTIFLWSNVTGTPAAAITNAPVNVTYMLVSPQFQVFALGCNQESGGVFNPLCVRHSAVRDETSWTTGLGANDTSREYVLPGGGRIVAGRVVGKNLLIWTNWGLFIGTYIGQVNQVWRFDLVARNCGLIGPGAVAVLGSTAYWPSPDRQFYAYSLGGGVEPIDCPIRDDFAENLSASQSDKIIASTVAEFNEVRWDYPDGRDGHENSRYIALAVDGPDAGSWYKGVMARTAMVDAGPSLYPMGVTYEGQTYWHERGTSADGAALEWFIETAEIYIDPNVTVLGRQLWPDISGQLGPVNLTLYARQFPQGDVTTYGPTAMAPGLDRVDFKAKGRLFRMRYAGNSAPSFARIGRSTLDYKICGRR
jgi:hypothetical protein